MAKFIITSFFLGIALAMDAFSVSVANALQNTRMKRNEALKIAGTFAFFQWLMPMCGWFAVTSIVNLFNAVQRFIPWVALFLLVFIGIRMILESGKCEENTCIDNRTLFIQGIATSIDALSVGFTIAAYSFMQAMASTVIIAAVTFVICILGVLLGKRIGTKIKGKAGIVGGIILIIIGLEIFFT